MTTRGWPLAPALAIVVALGLSACGDDDDASSGTTVDDGATTTAGDDVATTGTTGAATPEQQAVAAYERAWEAEFEALDPPNPQHPALRQSFTGPAAAAITDIVVTAQMDGHYTVGSMETHPTVVSATAEEVRLRDCTVEDSTSYDSATDEVREQGPYPPRSREVLVVNDGGTWRVSEIETLEEPCTPG